MLLDRLLKWRNVLRANPGKQLIQAADCFVQADIALARTIGDKLAEVYQGYHWFVNVDHEIGIVTIECGELNSVLQTNFTPKSILHTDKIHDHGILVKKVIRFCGELLERASLPRGKWNGEYPKRVDGLKEEHQPAPLFNDVPKIRIIPHG